ncbi:MAG: hypothetical protein AAF585_05475 [Verrucomicrobiota bacterium]
MLLLSNIKAFKKEGCQVKVTPEKGSEFTAKKISKYYGSPFSKKKFHLVFATDDPKKPTILTMADIKDIKKVPPPKS